MSSGVDGYLPKGCRRERSSSCCRSFWSARAWDGGLENGRRGKKGRERRPAAAPVERAVEELGRTYLVKPVMFETAAAAAAAAAAGQVVTVGGVLKGVVVVVVDVLSCSRGGNVNGECTNEKEQKWCGV